MKLPEHTTPAQIGPTLREISRWHEHLRELHARLRPHFARPEAHQHALRYLQAILSDIPRKNGWQIAEHARESRPYGMQRLLSTAAWDQDAVRDELRALVIASLSGPLPSQEESADEAPFPVLVVDVGVFLSYVTARGHALIDRELYLPEDWCADLPRRHAAHIPETVTFQTKPELARLMVQRAQSAHLPFRWVVADTVYGHCPDLRLWLEEQGHASALAVPSTEVVCVQIAADAAYDYWYVYETVAHRQGIAAIPLNNHGHEEVPRDPDGTPRCSQGLRMTPTYQFQHSNGYRAQRFRCPLLFPQPTGQTCEHDQFAKAKGCVKDPNWEKGGLMRALLDRSSPLYHFIYNQRTACERINSQAQVLGIERPKVRNIHSVRNLNTLTYVVINVRVLADAQSINKGLLHMN